MTRHPDDSADQRIRSRAEQVRLDLDAAIDQPVPFVLTARARRLVDPAGLPELSVVSDEQEDEDDDPPLDDPDDTRPARARALRRAGMDPGDIACELAVDELVVRAWTGDVRGGTRHVPRLRAVTAQEPPSAPPPDAVFSEARCAANAAARTRLEEGRFAAGLGLLSGMAQVDPGSITIAGQERAAIGRALRWLRSVIDIPPTRVRVILRLGTGAAADQAVADWAAALQIPEGRIRTTRTGHGSGEDVSAIVRVIGEATAGTLAGWRDALLDDPDDDPLDLAF